MRNVGQGRLGAGRVAQLIVSERGVAMAGFAMIENRRATCMIVIGRSDPLLGTMAVRQSVATAFNLHETRRDESHPHHAKGDEQRVNERTGFRAHGGIVALVRRVCKR